MINLGLQLVARHAHIGQSDANVEMHMTSPQTAYSNVNVINHYVSQTFHNPDRKEFNSAHLCRFHTGRNGKGLDRI